MEELAGLVGLLEWVQEEQVWYLGLVDPVELEQEPLNLEKVTVLVDLEFYQVEAYDTQLELE